MRVIRNDFCNLVDIAHTIAALVETKAPVRHHDSLADDFGVLLSSLDRSGPRNEVEVYDSTNGVVLEELAV